jgi:hypothetical protein
MKPTTTTAAPDLSIASFEVLIKEIEQEEEERKRKRSPLPVAPQNLITPFENSASHKPSPEQMDVLPSIAQLRTKRPNAHHEAKRRSTGSILFNQLTPTFQAFDKENSFPFLGDRKHSTTSVTQGRRLSIASFGSQPSDSKRNSAREITFNFVDWSGLSPGGCAVSERRANNGAVLGRSDSVMGSFYGDFDQSRRSSSYNFGRRGSVF